MKSRAHVIIYGNVQGVFFRSFVKSNANLLEIRGWVRNISGAVEAVFEGEDEKIRRMIDLCKQGPPSAEVNNVDVKWETSKSQFSEFEIKR